jgi:serine/threonine-protein kinase
MEQHAIPDFDGRYLEVTPISERAISCTFGATDSRDGRRVFIKMLHPSRTGDANAIRFFHNEHAILRMLAARAPEVRVVPVLEIGEWNNRAYFVQPLLVGWSLDRALRLRRIFSGNDALRVVEGCLQSIDVLHGAGVAHGDISPDNIFIETEEPFSERGDLPDEFTVRLVDFNSARRMSGMANNNETSVLLKIPYSPPELAQGKPLTIASDLYSLGVVFYELLVGERPAAVRSMADLARLNQLPPPIPLIFEVPERVESLIRSLLSPLPAGRPASASQCLRELRDLREIHRWLSRTTAPDVSVFRLPARAEQPGQAYASITEPVLSSGPETITGVEAPWIQSGFTGSPPPAEVPTFPRPVPPPTPPSVTPSAPAAVDFARGAAPPPVPVSPHFDEIRSEISAIQDVPIPSAEREIDRVDFSVFAPWTVSAGTSFILEVWAYLREHRDDVIERATRHGRLIERGSRGPLKTERGTELTLVLRIDGFNVDEPHESLFWLGDAVNVPFIVQAPAELSPGVYPGRISVLHNGMLLTRLVFDVEVGRESAEAGKLGLRREQIKTAFASYASADRDEVLRRVQGIVAAGVDVFLDVLSLRAGDEWEDLLVKNIREKDIFYLFWSVAAAKSQWVDREWRFALSEKGADCIHPIPLSDPREAPPPPELAHRHFNDLILACLKSSALADSH